MVFFEIIIKIIKNTFHTGKTKFQIAEYYQIERGIIQRLKQKFVASMAHG